MEVIQSLRKTIFSPGIYLKELEIYLETPGTISVYKDDENEYHLFNYLPSPGGSIPIGGYWKDLDESGLVFMNGYLGSTTPGSLAVGEYNFEYVVKTGIKQTISIPLIIEILEP